MKVLKLNTCGCMQVKSPEFLFGVQVGVEQKVNSQLKTLFGHWLVAWMLQFCLQKEHSFLKHHCLSYCMLFYVYKHYGIAL